MLYLSRFDFTLKHIPGVRIGKVDGLSRRSDLKVRAENDNENQKLIKENIRNNRSSSRKTGGKISGKNKKNKRKEQKGSEISRENKESRS